MISTDSDYEAQARTAAGSGISAEAAEKLFERLYQESEPNQSSRKGLGLGLYICSQIVRAHAGVLSVTSTRENGTVFKVRLPVRRPAD